MKCKRCLWFKRIRKKGMVPSPRDYKEMPEHDEGCPCLRALNYLKQYEPEWYKKYLAQQQSTQIEEEMQYAL